MKAITDTEHCDIIDSACPYNHGCHVCRLHNDYEAALEKSRELAVGIIDQFVEEDEGVAAGG